jgi:hypothetical protein
VNNEKNEALSEEQESSTDKPTRGRKPKVVEAVEPSPEIEELKQKVYNLEQALARVAHATGAVQFTDHYKIKKIPE